MKRLLSPIIVIVLLIAPLCYCQQNAMLEAAKPVPIGAQTVAANALKIFPAIVSKINFRVMGFRSATEPSRATLGQPMKVFKVWLDSLRQYKAPMKPETLLKKADSRIMFPLNINNQARCAITVALRKNRWVATRFGSANLTKFISSAMQASRKKTRLPQSAYSVVRVYALNMVFVAHWDKTTKNLMLTPILDIPEIDLKAGSSMPADKVFEKLVPLAQSHNGLPT